MLCIERQIGSNWLVSTAYTGSRQLHLWTQEQLNPGTVLQQRNEHLRVAEWHYDHRSEWPVFDAGELGPTQETHGRKAKRRQYIALLSEFKGDGTMNYHGLIVNFQRRAVKGVSFSGNYTWSHCVGDRTDFNGSGPNPGQDDWLVDNNRRGDRGNCDSDRRQTLNTRSMPPTPDFSGDMLRKIGSGWRLSVINRLSSGSPLSVVLGHRPGIERQDRYQRPTA